MKYTIKPMDADVLNENFPTRESAMSYLSSLIEADYSEEYDLTSKQKLLVGELHNLITTMKATGIGLVLDLDSGRLQAYRKNLGTGETVEMAYDYEESARFPEEHLFPVLVDMDYDNGDFCGLIIKR